MSYEEILARTPTDPVHAQNYSTLFDLWKTAHDGFLPGDADEQNFADWDKAVQQLLTPAERAFYLSPLGNLNLNVFEYRSVSRINHLTKIMVHRQGIRTPNGFNG